MQKTIIDSNGFSIYRGDVGNIKFRALVAAGNVAVEPPSPSEFHRWDGTTWVEDTSKKQIEESHRDALKQLAISDKNIPRRLEDLMPLFLTLFTAEQIEQASPGLLDKINERKQWRGRIKK